MAFTWKPYLTTTLGESKLPIRPMIPNIVLIVRAWAAKRVRSLTSKSILAYPDLAEQSEDITGQESLCIDSQLATKPRLSRHM